MESRYNRVVSTSLNAYVAFWDQVAQSPIVYDASNKTCDNKTSANTEAERWKHLRAAIEKTMEIHKEILNDGKFWKLSQNKATEVTNLFYQDRCYLY